MPVIVSVNKRTCSQCGETKPLTSEFFYFEPKNGTRRPLRRCRVCEGKRRRERNAMRERVRTVRNDPELAAVGVVLLCYAEMIHGHEIRQHKYDHRSAVWDGYHALGHVAGERRLPAVTQEEFEKRQAEIEDDRRRTEWGSRCP